MTAGGIAPLQAEFERLEAALQGPLSMRERAELKAAIVALFERTDAAVTEVTAFKERIRELVDRFKALPAPEGGATTVRHDHLGASTHIERGWSALAAGEWGSAESHLRQAVALDATSTTALALLGWALMHAGRHDEALESCLAVLLREPDHGLARVGVGAICLQKGIVGEAIEHLSRAASESDDGRAVLYANFWLGTAYLQRDMRADAVTLLRRAVTQGPNLAEGWAELGRSLWLDGQHADAQEAWATGAAIRHSPHAARCAELLESVTSGGNPPRSPGC